MLKLTQNVSSKEFCINNVIEGEKKFLEMDAACAVCVYSITQRNTELQLYTVDVLSLFTFE